MLTFLKKYPFQTYATAIALLATSAYFLRQKQIKREKLQVKIQEEMWDSIRWSYYDVSKIYEEVLYRRPRFGYKENKEVEYDVEAINGKYKALHNALGALMLKLDSKNKDELLKAESEVKRLRKDFYLELQRILSKYSIPLSNINHNKLPLQRTKLYSIWMADLKLFGETLVDLGLRIRERKLHGPEDVSMVFSFESAITKVGKPILGEVFLTPYINADDLLTVVVNGDTLATKNGIALFEKVYSSSGLKDISVSISIHNPMTEKTNFYTKTLKAYVRP